MPGVHCSGTCFDNIDKAFDTNNSFEKHLLVKDYNTEISEPFIESFVHEYKLNNLVKEKACFKSVHNPGCIDLIIASNAITLHNTVTVFPGLSDFHILVLAVLKTSITKSKPQKIIIET